MDPTDRAPYLPGRRALLHRTALAAAGIGLPVWLRHARAADLPRFALGVASGHPGPGGVVLWTRLTGPALPAQVPVHWELARDERFGRIVARGSQTAGADDAHSVHAEVHGLEPAHEYWYRFVALGQTSPAGRTRTAPAADAEVERLEFAIASCQRWDHGLWAAWRDLAERPPELVLFLGDYIYEYATPALARVARRHEGGPTVTLEQYRARYAQYKSDPLLQAAHAMAPWIVIWDDHEVAHDYAGEQGERLEPDFPARRAAAYQAWWEHMPLPRALRPVQGRNTLYGRLDWGRLARLQWIDDRQFRDPQACPRPERGGGGNVVDRRACPALAEPGRALLGTAQERWLAAGWSLQHPWNLLAQQTLMARLVRPPAAGSDGVRVWTDGWEGYPAARARLLSVLAERRVPGAVVLGGDVHASYVAALRARWDDERAPVLASEFCGTSISSHGPPQKRLDAELHLNPHILHARGDQRGCIRFALTRARLEADLRAVADPDDAASAVTSQARFVVEAAQPGPQRA
ncbi:MAG: alkaline phosphatase D family protein [Rubrivivax sp.]|nr:alkaline phosphatase D family protein [Rubrivivax sp.]